jgi:hypothetical protein
MLLFEQAECRQETLWRHRVHKVDPGGIPLIFKEGWLRQQEEGSVP